MFDIDNCIYVYNTYVDSENAANGSIGHLEIAKEDVSKAINFLNTNFVIDGNPADNNALTRINNRIDGQITRIRRLIRLYNKCQDDMAKEAEENGEGFL